jgi:hypothetical protein
MRSHRRTCLLGRQGLDLSFVSVRTIKGRSSWRHSTLKALEMSNLIITSGSEGSELSAAYMEERILAQWEAAHGLALAELAHGRRRVLGQVALAHEGLLVGASRAGASPWGCTRASRAAAAPRQTASSRARFPGTSRWCPSRAWCSRSPGASR